MVAVVKLIKFCFFGVLSSEYGLGAIFSSRVPPLPTPLSNYFPVIFGSVVRLRHFSGTCARKIMEN